MDNDADNLTYLVTGGAHRTADSLRRAAEQEIADSLAETMTVEDYALGIWQSGTNDDVWEACFRWVDNPPVELVYEDPEGYPPGHTPGLVDVAGELLERIYASPDFTVGDLTHDQVIAAIWRRYPILSPNPNFPS